MHLLEKELDTYDRKGRGRKNKMEKGKEYTMVENIGAGLRFQVTYFGEVTSVLGTHHLFLHEGQRAHVHHCYFPSRDSFEDHHYGNVVVVNMLAEGEFKEEGDKVIALEHSKIIGFDDSLGNPNRDIANRLVKMIRGETN